MIKLARNLYKDFEEEYFAWVKEKLKHGKSLIRSINRSTKDCSKYSIDKNDHEAFLRALIICPFAKESRNKFPILKAYYQFIKGKRADPLLINKKSISNILNYKRFMDFSKNNKILREYIIEASKVEVCPYCNRQYIDVFKRSDKGYKAIAQLDHFYPKEQFPLYALSLYNFVPSCASCNQGKSATSNKLIYPFTEKSVEENRKPYFHIQPLNLDQLRGNVLPDISYAFNKDSTKKTQKKLEQAEFLHHKNMYQNHKQFAQRLLRVKRLDNSNYIAQVKDFFPKLSDEEIREVLFGFSGDLEELKQKPLSKLAHDILDLNKK